MTTDVSIAWTYAEAMAQAERDVDAVIDAYLEVIDLQMETEAILRGVVDDRAAALDAPPDPARARRRRLFDDTQLANTVRLRAWRARWLAALAVRFRRIYGALETPPDDPPAARPC